MVFADADKMLAELVEIRETIPNPYERQQIKDLTAYKQSGRKFLVPQYNQIVQLFNKYITIPAGPKYAGRSLNWRS